MDPDVITGYNIQNFDLPYLISRAQTLKVRQVGAGCCPDMGPQAVGPCPVAPEASWKPRLWPHSWPAESLKVPVAFAEARKRSLLS